MTAASPNAPARIPEYDTYTLLELYQVLNSIRPELVPHVYEALEKEIARRSPESVVELEDCYYALDREKNPGYADKLEQQIEALGGSLYTSEEAITEANRYRTFWRRYWAQVLDSAILTLPLGVVLFVLLMNGVITPASEPYVNQVAFFILLVYSIGMHASFGQTVGKMATGVKVVRNADGGNIGVKQALLRDLVPVVFFLVSLGYLALFGASIQGVVVEDATVPATVVVDAYAWAISGWGLAELVTMLFNAKRRAVHDFLAGTVVTRI